MAEFELNATSPFGNAEAYSSDFDNIKVREVLHCGIVSIAIPRRGSARLKKVITKGFKTTLPQTGWTTTSKIANARLVGMQADQLLVLFEPGQDDAAGKISRILGDTAYFTNQCDSYVSLRLTGPQSVSALQRICAIDLHGDNFPPGKFARTSMEHMSAIVICEKPDAFLLMSPRSSARSFLHAIETSILHTS